jgi:hypothetical protein
MGLKQRTETRERAGGRSGGGYKVEVRAVEVELQDLKPRAAQTTNPTGNQLAAHSAACNPSGKGVC